MSSALQVGFYPGCSLLGASEEYNISTKALEEPLGIKFVDVEDFNCCGASAGHSINPRISAGLNARNLYMASRKNNSVAVPCPACYNNLKTTSNNIKNDPQLAKQFDEDHDTMLNREMNVYSLLEFFYEKVGLQKIAEKVVKPLANYKVASYYGCLLVRPGKLTQFDDPERPASMDRIAEVCGAQVVDFQHKTECCGASFALSNKKMALSLSAKIVDGAIKTGANCIVVACPMCHQNLDLRQGQLAKYRKTTGNMPVIYFTQLIGLALGIDKLGLNKHSVKVAVS